MWGRAGRAGAGTKKSQVGEMWLRSPLSRVPERPPSTPGIHSLTQQLLLSTFSVAGTLIGTGSIAMDNQTQILPQGAYNLGVSIQWLQVFFLGHLEFLCSGSPSDFCSQAHGTHTRTQMAHLCTRIHTLSRVHSHAHALPRFAAPPPMLTPAHARTTCTRTLWPPPPCNLPLTPSVSAQVPAV